ncbi:MAG: acetyl-CoA carboxylase biotin carboxyl carrier protein [Clostridiales bacterium]|nr:acetyl-CoA carboxylase biotin carboxyl carrier protein [Clostridiales bacterium]
MDYKDIKKLIDDMGNSKLDEIKIEFPEGMKIEMKKNVGEKVFVNSNIQQIEKEDIQNMSIQKNDENICNKVEDNYKTIKSPMVGTFYSKPSPNAEPFVKVGDYVKKGQIVCIVEAMKLMNEIESEVDGEIVEICFNDEDMVEYGSILFKVK